MELDGYVDRVRTEFAAISDLAGDDVRDVAERLVTPLESTIRLVLLEALAGATDEITLDLAPGSVHLRLRGSAPDFVVTPAPAPGHPAVSPAGEAPVAPPPAPDAEGPVARINFRPPESLKNRVESAAARDGLSVNTWLTRVVAAALDRPDAARAAPTTAAGGRAGWFG